MDGGNGFTVVLGSPGEFPVAATDGPGSKADGGELKVGVAESAKRERSGMCHIERLDDPGAPQVAKKCPFQRNVFFEMCASSAIDAALDGVESYPESHPSRVAPRAWDGSAGGSCLAGGPADKRGAGLWNFRVEIL